MKLSSIRYRLLTLCLVLGALASQAAGSYTVVKRDLRSAWVATVWALDWPTIGASAATQKAEMTRLLDSLKNNNFNAVNFQVRSMCDAMYKSSLEPWSSYLTGTRGKDPGYDPLEFVVQECHKRGMEAHAWVNPYRFSTGSKWSTSQDTELKNSGHLLTYGSTTILDPGQQWTIDRIVAVCREIVSNYDVDGILYDDYFYPNGIPSNSNAGDYAEWQNSGTSLSIGDWRRDNVNRMVKAVYNMIQTVKPWVRFGISPAGVACTSSSVAAKYGVEPSFGSDWQYNGIFSDPLAWYASKSVDFISPQIYWTIGHSTADYAKLTPWWGTVAAKFGRHVYISNSISNLTSTSTGSQAPALSGIEGTKASAPIMKASGPNAGSYDEYVREVEMARSTNQQDAPGNIWYSCKYLYRLGAKESLAHYLKRTIYSRPALPPVMTWKAGNNPGVVRGLTKVAYNLQWQGYDNVRYTVYAVPEGTDQATFNKDVACLLGMTYATTFTIPEPYRVGYQYAVCVLDRVGNEYSPIFLGSQVRDLAAPQLLTPAAGAAVDDPFTFSWKPVSGATDYTLEVAADSAFTSLVGTAATQGTSLSSTAISGLKGNVTHYWRVHACAANCNDGISPVQAFTPMILQMTYPQAEQQDVMPTFTAKWNSMTTDPTDVATVQISSDEGFNADDVVWSASVTGASQVSVPKYVLFAGTRYYIRVTVSHQSMSKTSAAVGFTTAFLECDAPTFVTPTDGGVLLSTQRVSVLPQQGARTSVIEVAATSTVTGRSRYVETLPDHSFSSAKLAAEIKLASSYLKHGSTYYARARATYINTGSGVTNTDYCPIISFTYKWAPGDLDGNGVLNVNDVTALINVILSTATAPEDITDLTGNGLVNVDDVTALINKILAK